MGDGGTAQVGGFFLVAVGFIKAGSLIHLPVSGFLTLPGGHGSLGAFLVFFLR